MRAIARVIGRFGGTIARFGLRVARLTALAAAGLTLVIGVLVALDALLLDGEET